MMSLTRVSTLSAMLAISVTPAAWADFVFEDFSDVSRLRLRGDAGTTMDALRVQPAGFGVLGAGAAWFAERQSIACGFIAEFAFRLSEPGGGADPTGQFGADGLAFVVQNESDFAIGGEGGGIGYGGISSALVVEFDTWQNSGAGDLTTNDISVLSGGVGRVSADYAVSGIAVTPFDAVDFNDGVIRRVRIEYAPGTLTVSLDGSEVLTTSIELAGLIGLTDGTAYVGFTAGVGGAWAQHDVLNWSFVSTKTPDCNSDGALNIADFICFQNSFALGDLTRADCDKNGLLDIIDFVCFQNRFAIGCP